MEAEQGYKIVEIFISGWYNGRFIRGIVSCYLEKKNKEASKVTKLKIQHSNELKREYIESE